MRMVVDTVPIWTAADGSEMISYAFRPFALSEAPA
jgi:hypothetical protein